ncbi:hypothetical protein SASPL_109792 [Salvia splendens]|uniref:UDP N-acetylglucosamine O-acyltransferase C-terminal domain-containing protein n=1 Tax=Salvia splendens TaxID=180675 RepID=A0A8X8YHT3_SALSN|nr:hypothetical protein SASPL_109792 [Salvia splendens]
MPQNPQILDDGFASRNSKAIVLCSSTTPSAMLLHLTPHVIPLADFKEEQKMSCMETGGSSSFIHPSAVVHPDAILGQGVSVGPFCTVGPSANLGNGCQLYPGSHVCGHTKIGDDCTLMMGAVVGDDLPGSTVIGNNNLIGHHAVVGIKCQDLKYKVAKKYGMVYEIVAIQHALDLLIPKELIYLPGNECFLEIGDNNEIREYVSIHRSSHPDEKTIIGANNLIMGSCHIAHDCKMGNYNIFANNTLLAGHVNVENYTHTAGATVIHQFCHIGSFSFIGGGSVVSQDVPKYTMVSGERAELRGLNLEGLRRRGFSVGEIKSLRTAYRKIFMPSEGSCHSIEDRLTELEKDDELGQVAAVCLMVESIRDSFAEDRRGICKFSFGGEGGRRRLMGSSEPSGASETPTGGSGEAHAPSWDYSWGWGSTPTSGWGYGSGSGKSPNGFARGSGFGFGSGSGSGSGYGYGSGSGGAHGGGHGSGNGNEGSDGDGDNNNKRG